MPADTILIVDDNFINLRLASAVLQLEGYDVLSAGDADEALAILQTSRPRMILMDIQLPGMDGLELTRKLKADPSFTSTIIVAMTAYAMTGDEDKAIAAGCDGYITKPIDTERLPREVARRLTDHA